MLSDEEIEDCISEARKSLRRHRSAIRGQMCVPADQLDWHVARAVERAAYERAKQACMEIGKEIVCPEECAAAIDALGRQHD